MTKPYYEDKSGGVPEEISNHWAPLRDALSRKNYPNPFCEVDLGKMAELERLDRMEKKEPMTAIRSHHAKIGTSPRLQKLLAVLKEGGSFTTLELIRRTGLCAINSAIDELRSNHYIIECRHRERTAEANVYEYSLKGGPDSAPH